MRRAADMDAGFIGLDRSIDGEEGGVWVVVVVVVGVGFIDQYNTADGSIRRQIGVGRDRAREDTEREEEGGGGGSRRQRR